MHFDQSCTQGKIKSYYHCKISRQGSIHHFQRNPWTPVLSENWRIHLNYNTCAHRFTYEKHHIYSICHINRKYRRCKNYSMCNAFCSDFEPVICSKLSKPPYCCNGCIKRYSGCSLEKRLYIASDTHDEYLKSLSEFRTGISFSEAEISYLDKLVSPLIKQGQSPHHLCITNRISIMISERTLYCLIDSCVISAINFDLPRKVHFSARKSPVHFKVDKSCRINWYYSCFLSFMKEHSHFPVTKLDSVERKAEKLFLPFTLQSQKWCFHL